MHSRYVESEGHHFMFYWMIRVEVDCCISGGWFSIYVYFEVCLFTCYCQVQEINSFVGFISGVEFYVYFINFTIIYNQVLTFAFIILDY